MRCCSSCPGQASARAAGLPSFRTIQEKSSTDAATPPTSVTTRASGRSCRGRGVGEDASRDARRHKRAHEVGAAALVLARARLAVLVASDRDVLGAVVGGERGAAQGEHGRGKGDDARDRLAGGRREPAAAEAAHDERARPEGGRHPRALVREPGVGQRAAHDGHEREHLGDPRRAAQERRCDVGGDERLAPGGDLEDAVLAAHGAGPVPGAVHEHAVLERKSSQANATLHRVESTYGRQADPTVRARSQRNCVPSSRSSTGMRSSAEWMRRPASSDDIVRMGKKPYAIVPNASRR